MYTLAEKTTRCITCLSRMQTWTKRLPVKASLRLSSTVVTGKDVNLQAMPDLEYLLNPDNRNVIRKNILRRKGVGDIDALHQLYEEYRRSGHDSVKKKLIQMALLIPNRTSDDTMSGSQGRLIRTLGMRGNEEVEGQVLPFEQICQQQGLLRIQQMPMSSLVYGPRSYSLMGDLARLERVLVRWTIDRLTSKGWKYVVVPDLLSEQLVNACGFVTTGKQNQIYRVREDQGGFCLAGTSEIPLACLFAGQTVNCDEPMKLCAYSSCYRAEEAKNRIDKGFYRLHQFTKVEMFAICKPEQSDALLDEVVSTQCDLFSDLELHCRLVQMPSEELGASAYKKYDVEAWMTSLKHWGEISSASNCTDYQARRLAITREDNSFVHTVNGTGCAIPRMLLAIVDQGQLKPGVISVPECLQDLMGRSHLHPSPLNTLEIVRSRPKHLST